MIDNFNIETARKNSNKFKDTVINTANLFNYKSLFFEYLLNLEKQIDLEINEDKQNKELRNSHKEIKNIIRIYIFDLSNNIPLRDLIPASKLDFLQEDITGYINLTNQINKRKSEINNDGIDKILQQRTKDTCIENSVFFQDCVDSNIINFSYIKSFIEVIINNDEKETDKYYDFFKNLNDKSLSYFINSNSILKILWPTVLEKINNEYLDNSIMVQNNALLIKIYRSNPHFLEKNFRNEELLILKSNLYKILTEFFIVNRDYSDFKYEIENSKDWLDKLELKDSEFLSLFNESFMLIYILKKNKPEILDTFDSFFKESIMDETWLYKAEDFFSLMIIVSSIKSIVRCEGLELLLPDDYLTIFSDIINSDTKLTELNAYKNKDILLGDLIIELYLSSMKKEMKFEKRLNGNQKNNLDDVLSCDSSISKETQFLECLIPLIPILNISNKDEEQRSFLNLIFFILLNKDIYREKKQKNENDYIDIKEIWNENIYIIRDCNENHISLLKNSILDMSSDITFPNDITKLSLSIIYDKASRREMVDLMNGLDFWLEEKILDMRIPEATSLQRKLSKF